MHISKGSEQVYYNEPSFSTYCIISFSKSYKIFCQKYQKFVLCDGVHEGSFCYLSSGMHLKSNVVECITKEGN